MLARDYARGMRERLYEHNKPVIEVTDKEWLGLANKVESLSEMDVKKFEMLVLDELNKRERYYHEQAEQSEKEPNIQYYRQLRERSYHDAAEIVKNVAKLVLERDKEALVQNTPVVEDKSPKTYEVAFVVEGHVSREDADLGNLECNGLEHDTDNGGFYVKDGRAYYSVEASSPSEARDKALVYFEVDDLGEVEVTNSSLEHVSLGDTYWYESDIARSTAVEEDAGDMER